MLDEHYCELHVRIICQCRVTFKVGIHVHRSLKFLLQLSNLRFCLTIRRKFPSPGSPFLQPDQGGLILEYLCCFRPFLTIFKEFRAQTARFWDLTWWDLGHLNGGSDCFEFQELMTSQSPLHKFINFFRFSVTKLFFQCDPKE